MFTNRRYVENREDIEARGSSGHEIDIENLAGSMAKILDDVPQYMCSQGHPGRISRIPESLRVVDEKAYEPCFVSIGPYHHGKPRLEKMEKKKEMILKCFLQSNPELTSIDYLNEFKSIEREARSFYSDVEMDSEKFVLMLLLDSVFLITLFCGMPESEERMNQTNAAKSEDNNDLMHYIEESVRSRDGKNMQMMSSGDELDEAMAGRDDAPRMYSALLTHDLFLLENQLPFFLLQKIHDLAYADSKVQLICLVKDTIGNALLDYTKLDSEYNVTSNEEVHHLLHVCHMFFRPTLQQEPINFHLLESTQMFRLGSAVQLYEAGVKFVVRSDSSQHSLLDITFTDSGKMVMPCLSVDDNTNSLLRNLIALEQMKYPNLGLNVSSYSVLLLHLVTTPEDAELLRRKGVIQHHLASDKEMMYLVNKLSVGLSFDYAEDNYSLKTVFQELKGYTERRVPRWRAWLRHRYFNNPWTMISLMAASMLLILSGVQTYFAVYSYYRPCNNCHP